MLCLSVIVCAHNPSPDRLGRTVAGLMAQSLDPEKWQLLIIDNASQDQTGFDNLDFKGHPHARVVRENTLGLTAARLRGFAESTAEIIVLVDDDNILNPTYLETVVRVFTEDPKLGAIGGRSYPEFESPVWPCAAVAPSHTPKRSPKTPGDVFLTGRELNSCPGVTTTS